MTAASGLLKLPVPVSLFPGQVLYPFGGKMENYILIGLLGFALGFAIINLLMWVDRR